MRLNDQQLDNIRKIFQQHFSQEDHLWLFGSRVDDTKRGGDLDLYLETTEKNTKTVVSKKINFVVNLQLAIGDQKIDVVINQLPLGHDLPIYHIAKSTGVKLI